MFPFAELGLKNNDGFFRIDSTSYHAIVEALRKGGDRIVSFTTTGGASGVTTTNHIAYLILATEETWTADLRLRNKYTEFQEEIDKESEKPEWEK